MITTRSVLITASLAIVAPALAAAQDVVYVRDQQTALSTIVLPGAGGWTQLDGELGGGVDACVTGSGHVYVVTLGQDGAIFIKTRPVGGDWTIWESLGGQFTADPSVACEPRGRGVAVFGRGPAGDVQFKMYDPADRPGPYRSLGAEIKGGPDATSSGDGVFDVVVRGLDDEIWYMRIDRLQPRGWRPLGGGGKFNADPAITAIQRQNTVYLEVFGRGLDNALWHGAVEPEGQETTWLPLGGSLGGSPDAMAGDRFGWVVAARWSDNTVRTLTFAGERGAWQSLGGRTTADVGIAGNPRIRSHTMNSLPVAESEARFRVTVTGMRVERETYDDMLERDGARDEVFLLPATFMVSRQGRVLPGNATSLRDVLVLGQTHRDRPSMMAGSATASGGLKSGDNFPEEPWDAHALPGALSQTFEGVLRRGENAAVIIPTLWEWDGNDDMAARYLAGVQRGAAAVAQAVAERIAAPQVERRVGSFVVPGHNLGLSQVHRWDGGPANRPIGVRRIGQHVSFTPKVLVLTYEAADLIARNRFDELVRIGSRNLTTFGPEPLGVFPIQYDDDDEFKGRYTLFIRVTRCASLDRCE